MAAGGFWAVAGSPSYAHVLPFCYDYVYYSIYIWGLAAFIALAGLIGKEH